MKFRHHVILALLPLTVSGTALGHARLTGALAFRNTNAGNKTGPCGAGTRNAAPTYLKSGSDLKITWEETIQHPGYFLIQFAPNNDTGFEANQLARIEDTQNDQNLPHRYEATVKLPAMNCDNCTIRLIQVMTENPANPTNYYSCADVKLTVDGKDPNASTSTATSTSTSTSTTKTKTDTSTSKAAEETSSDAQASPAKSEDANCKK